MIALPAILANNWKVLGGAVIGAALCYPVASCSGRRAANATQAEKVIAASAVVHEAAAKAETAAVLADMARTANTIKEVDELREVINETKSDADVGPATAAVLARLREKRGGAAHPGS